MTSTRGPCLPCNTIHVNPNSKRCKLLHLLDHWDDIYDPNTISPNGQPGNGTNTPHLSGMARHRSVVELNRCLALLQVEAPVQHAHLKAFHCAEWRTHRWVESKRRKGGKLERVDRSERQRLVPAWVRLEKVRRAEDRLVVLFRGPVEIPEELWDALTLSAEEVADKERRRRAARKVAA